MTGIISQTRPKAKGTLPSRRDELLASIREGLSPTESVHVELISASELQAIVNQRPALREAFFGDRIFDTWDETWNTMALQPNTRPDVPLIGRAERLVLLKAKLADTTVRFIGIVGASGMGKTRLGLEATRDISAQAFFVRPTAKSAFLAKSLEAYATPNRSIFVVEDLRLEEAKALAEQAAIHSGVCILASIPAEEHLPRFGLSESPAVFSLRLPPLNSNESRELLQAAKAQLDHDAFEWAIQEAGGNPQILLVAAAMGSELRHKTGLLREQVAQNFLGKAKALLGNDVEPVLELLSVLSPFDIRKEAHVQAARSAFGLTAGSAEIRHFRKRLIDAALAESSGRGGHELNISPPLFAAFLVERVLEGHPERCLTLYEQLDDDGRKRFFERLISVDSPEGHGLWAHLFGSSGPFVGPSGIEQNEDALRILARAAPRQTAAFLERRLTDLVSLLGRKKLSTPDSLADQLADSRGHHQYNQRIDHFRSTMQSVVHELVDHPDSSRVTLGLLERIVVADVDSTQVFAKLFTECFVLWNYGFPVPPSERWPIVERLTRSPRPLEQKLGFDALFHISDPPDSTSGQAVERRRMGSQITHVTWRDVWDYHVRAFEAHLTVATKAGPFRTAANERLPGALAELRRLPPAQTMALLRRVKRAFWRKALVLKPANYLGCLLETRKRFAEIWEKQRQAEWATGIPAFDKELGAMISRVDDGPFALRLTIWIDRQPGFGWDPVPGTELQRYEVELEKLAAEAVAQPHLFTTKLAALLVSVHSTHGAEFAQRLGRSDRAKRFWAKFETLQSRPDGAWVFASYCDGLGEHDPGFVEQALEQAMPKAGASMLMVLKKLGPTARNRHRLLALLKKDRVTPSELAGMFYNGRWLGNLPVREVRTLLSYIARDRSPETTYGLLQVFDLYLYQKKKIPRPLLPVAERVLLRRAQYAQDTDFDSDNLAEAVLNTNIAAGLRLFRRLMLSAASPNWSKRGWNPVNGFGGAMDFYHRIRARCPKLAYSALFDYLASTYRVDSLDHDAAPFDLEHHAGILLDLTKNKPARALAVARNIRSEQPGFWPFVYTLLALHPNDVRVRNALVSIFANELPWGYLDGTRIDAGLQFIDRELAHASVPPHGRIFLQEVRTELIKRDAELFGPEDHERFDNT